MKLNNTTAKTLKKDFPIFEAIIKGKKLIYLDNASTTQKPKTVIQAITSFYTKENANVHRGVYPLSEQATQQYGGAHAVVAACINADPQEIIFTKGTTEAINLLAYTLPRIIPQGKNEILLTEMEHHANLVPWQQCAQRHGYKLQFIKMKDDYTLDYTDAEKKITEKTAVLSVAQVSNALGTIHDVKRLIALAKKKEVFTIIDAAQSVPRMAIDVKALECDFLAFSAHKMYGPTGLGVLYGRKELLLKLPPFLFGGDMIKSVSYSDATWNDLPTKFEAGTPPIAEAIGFAATMHYLQNIGMEHIAAWEQELSTYALEKLRLLKGITLYTPAKTAGIISFSFKNAHAHDVASLLGDAGICIRGGHHCAMPLMEKLGIAGTARISFSLYNTFEDVDQLVIELKKAQELFD